MAAIAGIGFTVSIFVAGLAFNDPNPADQATIGVLVAAVGSAILIRGAPTSASDELDVGM